VYEISFVADPSGEPGNYVGYIEIPCVEYSVQSSQHVRTEGKACLYFIALLCLETSLVANDAEIISRFSDNTAHGVTYVYGISVAPLGEFLS